MLQPAFLLLFLSHHILKPDETYEPDSLGVSSKYLTGFIITFCYPLGDRTSSLEITLVRGSVPALPGIVPAHRV